MKGNGSQCRFMCQDKEHPLYLEEGECKQCDGHCSSCVSGSDRECRECKDPYYLGKYSECIYTDCANYPNTFSSQGICLLCDENCLGCSNYSYNCLACAPQYFLFKDTNINYCIPHCPTAYYSNTQLYICQRIYIYIYIYSMPRILRSMRGNRNSKYRYTINNRFKVHTVRI